MALFSTLRARLILVFLLLALVPSLVLTFLTSRRLSQSIEYWSAPAVEGSLEEAMDLFRGVLLEKRTEMLSVLESLDGDLSAAATSEEARRRLDQKFRATDLDLLCMIERDGESGTRIRYFLGPQSLFAELAGSSLYTEEELPTSFLLAESCLVVVRPLEEESGRFVLAGMGIDRSMVETSAHLSSTLERYRQLDVYQVVSKQMVWIIFGVLTVLVVLSSSLLARSLASSVTKPVTALEQGMRTVAGGNLDHRVHARGTDEINFLVDSFNRMTDELKVSKEKLRRAERMAAWREIARRVAHEIKNPLLPMRFAIGRLKESVAQGDGPARGDIENALTSVSEQIETLTDLASKFSELGKLPEPSLAPVDLSEVIRGLVPLYQSELCRFELELSEKAPAVMADKNQISRVFVNLISNALDAMDGKGVVRIGIKHRSVDGKEWIQTSVSDSGKGIPKEMRERIFDPYFTTKAKGTGLGLAIVSKIVSDHEGNVTVESEEGKGSTFTVSLPVRGNA